MRLGRAADLYSSHAGNVPQGPDSPNSDADADDAPEDNGQPEATQEELAHELFGSDSE